MSTSEPISREMALNALIIDFNSAINQRAYRLMVSIPAKPAPAGGHPVVYLIDGNLHFGITVDTARIQACWPDVNDPVVVGIGYATDSVATALKVRMKDLTSPITPERLAQGWLGKMGSKVEELGGMDEYLRVIDEEVKPRIEALTAIDRSQQTLMGHSLGGLTTLHALFRRSASFRHFIAVSPSIWWNDRAVLAHEAAFAAGVKAGQVQARLLITCGAEEDQAREVPGLPASREDFAQMAAECRMVLNTEELGARLAALASPGLAVKTVIHIGDDHNTAPAVGIAHGIRFAMRRSEW